MVAKILERPTLVLNRNWQPVNVATVERALTMLWNESARVVDPHDFRLYDWADWSQLRPTEGELFIQAVRLRLRVPEVITLTGYDRLPTAAVAFSRRTCSSVTTTRASIAVSSRAPRSCRSTTSFRGRKAALRPGRTACWRAWRATSARPTARRSRPA